MAVLVTPYVYVDNTVLDAQNHNKNLYSTTPGQGILSEPNGGVDSDNLASSFEIKPDHLQPEQLTFARAQGSVSTLDNMGDANFTAAGPRDLDDPASDTYREITHLSADETMAGQMLAGCGIRVYLPFDASVVLWHASLFWHVARFSFPDLNDFIRIPPALIITRMEIDGVGEPHTRREYPPTVFQKSADDYMNSIRATHTSALQTTEVAMSQHRDICHMSTDMSAGFHEMYVSFYVEPRGNLKDVITVPLNDYYVNRNPVYSRQNLSVRGVDYYIKQIQLENRFTVGCRHARVVAFR